MRRWFLDVTVLLHNNFFFGMTRGQHSALTPLRLVTATSANPVTQGTGSSLAEVCLSSEPIEYTRMEQQERNQRSGSQESQIATKPDTE